MVVAQLLHAFAGRQCAAGDTVFLERLDRSPRLSLPLVAYKTLVSIAFYELPGELEIIGYGSERRRWRARIEAGP